MSPKRKIFYGWYIVAISIAIMTVASAVYNSWPIFYIAILNEFGWSRADTALIFSTASMVYGFGSPIAGALFDKFGPRRLFILATALIVIGVAGSVQATEIWQLCVFFGVFVGFGACLAGFIPLTALVSNWFEKKRATAIGISQLGMRDVFLFLPLIELAITAIGWRNSYLVLATAVVVVAVPLSTFLRARPQDMGLLPDGETAIEEKGDKGRSKADSLIVDKKWASTDWTLLKAMKKSQFWALFVIFIGNGITALAIISHFAAFVTDIGFSGMFAAQLFLILAIVGMVGRLFGFLSDRIGREVIFTIFVAFTLFTLPILFFIKDTSAPWMLYLFVVGYSFGGGVYLPAFTAATADLFGGKRFGIIVGSANTGFGLGASIGTWLFGYIFDVTGTYYLGFVIAIAAMLIQILAIWVARPRKVRRVAGKAPK